VNAELLWKFKRQEMQTQEAEAVATRRKDKKEEFPGFMGNMLPGNSFPQICVVSEMSFAEVTLGYKSTKVRSI
jgi:hypothetical protein